MNYREILRRLKRRPRINGYVSPDTEVRKSPIHGLGLFARKEIAKGTVVAVWGGRVTTVEEIRKLPNHISDNYALQIYPGFYLAERSEDELDSADFINHSCSANCKNVNQFAMVTKRKVHEGEELTSDFSNHKGYGSAMKCVCGSKNCKKIIHYD